MESTGGGELSAALLQSASGVVNASGIGGRGVKGDVTPLGVDALASLSRTAWILDCAYAAEPAGTKTIFVKNATDRGLRAANGSVFVFEVPHVMTPGIIINLDGLH